jgi:hypothetical protein
MLDLEAIKERLRKATPGPWAWRENDFRPKYMKQKKNGWWMARPGRRADQSWVMLLTGPIHASFRDKEFTPEDFQRGFPDEWDFPHILALRWAQVRVKSLFNVAPKDADMELIANAPADIKALIEEVERLRNGH